MAKGVGSMPAAPGASLVGLNWQQGREGYTQGIPGQGREMCKERLEVWILMTNAYARAFLPCY